MVRPHKRIGVSSCFCLKCSRAMWKHIDLSPKEIRVHFILPSGCLMHVDRIILYKGTGK